MKKEYESLSEAHNSLEQLNSNWSEQNMEQKTKIESMLKEEDELKARLAQAEEGLQSQKESNEELKNTYSNKVYSTRLKKTRFTECFSVECVPFLPIVLTVLLK